jgi:hypothetical protein
MLISYPASTLSPFISIPLPSQLLVPCPPFGGRKRREEASCSLRSCFARTSAITHRCITSKSMKPVFSTWQFSGNVHVHLLFLSFSGFERGREMSGPYTPPEFCQVLNADPSLCEGIAQDKLGKVSTGTPLPVSVETEMRRYAVPIMLKRGYA